MFFLMKSIGITYPQGYILGVVVMIFMIVMLKMKTQKSPPFDTF